LKFIRIQPRAQADAAQAMLWYEDRCPGLGAEFLLDLDQAITKAADLPLAYESLYGNVRRILTRRFPFAVYFIVQEESVEIIAIWHQQRTPGAWKSRAER
jgi:plasmid stabilization system protein ParE